MIFGVGADGFIVRIVRVIQQLRCVIGQRTVAFVEGFHGQQHAAYVGVHDDRVSRFFRLGRAGQRAHLQAVLGVGDRVLIGHFAMTQTLHTGTQAGAIHHGEHAIETLVDLADQKAGGAVEIHYAGGRSLDTHLVFDGAADHAVALALLAVGVGQELGHDEQRDALGAGRCVGQFGQHQMDDVLGHVVLAG